LSLSCRMLNYDNSIAQSVCSVVTVLYKDVMNIIGLIKERMNMQNALLNGTYSNYQNVTGSNPVR